MIQDPTTSDQTSIEYNLEYFFLYTYLVECFLKIVGMGFILNQKSYLRDPWNILDFGIVLSSLPQLIGQNSIKITALRSLRILRPLKSVSNIKQLKRILVTLFGALKDLLNTIIILVFFFLIFAIGGLQMFVGLLKYRCYAEETGMPHEDDIICGIKSCPDGYICGKMIANPNFGVTNFDNLAYSFLMVFQCVTMEGWSEIMYWLFDAFSVFVVFYFVVLIFIGSFFLLNLTLAVIKAKFTDPEGKKKRRNGDDEEEIDKPNTNQMSIVAMKNWRRQEREYFKKYYISQKFKNSGQKNLGILHQNLGPQNYQQGKYDELAQANNFSWEQIQRKLLNQKKILQQKLEWENIKKNKLHIAIPTPHEDTERQNLKLKTNKALIKGKVPHRPQGNLIYKLKKSETSQNSQTNIKFIGLSKQIRSKKNQNQKNSKNLIKNYDQNQNQNKNTKNSDSDFSQEEKEEWEEKIENFVEEQQALDFQRQNMLLDPESNENLMSREMEKSHLATSRELNEHKIDKNLENQEKNLNNQEKNSNLNSNQNSNFQGKDGQTNFSHQIPHSNLVLNNKRSSEISILQLKQKQKQGFKPSLFSQKINLNRNQIFIDIDENQNSQALEKDDQFSDLLSRDGQNHLNYRPNSTQNSNQDKSAKYEISNDVYYQDLLNDSDFDHDQKRQDIKKLAIQTLYDYKNVLKKMAKETNYVKNLKNQYHQQVFTFSDEDIKLASLYEQKSNKSVQNGDVQQDLKKKNSQQNNLTSKFQNFQNSLASSHYQFIKRPSKINQNQNQPVFKRGSKFNLLNKKFSSFSHYRYSHISNQAKSETNPFNTLKSLQPPRKFVSSKNGNQIFINPDLNQSISDEDFFPSPKSVSENDYSSSSNSQGSAYDSQFSENDENMDSEQEKKFNIIDLKRQRWDQQQNKNMYMSKKGSNTHRKSSIGSKSSKRSKNSRNQSARKSNSSNNKLSKSITSERRMSRFQQMQLNKKKYLQEEKMKILQRKKQEEEKKRKAQDEIDKKNVFKFKITINLDNYYVSNSIYDVLLHRLEQLEAQKEQDEHEQIKQKKYELKYRLKRNIERVEKNKKRKKKQKKIDKEELKQKQKEEKQKQIDLIQKRLVTALKSRQSILKSSQDLSNKKKTPELSFAARLLLVNSKKTFPIIRSNRTQEILYTKSFSSTPTASQKIEIEQKKKKRREVPLENDEEQLELTYRNLRRVIREPISLPKSALLIEQPNFLRLLKKQQNQEEEEQNKNNNNDNDKQNNFNKLNNRNDSDLTDEFIPSLSGIGLTKEQKSEQEKLQQNIQKELDIYNLVNNYLEIKKKDFITGQKIDDIWSGEDVISDFQSIYHHNSILKKLSTDKQDLKIWINGITGYIIVAHKHLKNFVSGGFFNTLMTTSVMLNTIVLAMDGLFDDQNTISLLNNFNTFFTYLFIVEMSIKLIGLTPLGYVRDKMNIFDGVIVIMSVFELIFFSGKNSAVSAFRSLRILRTFRVLRVTRLLRGLQFMAKIVQVIQRTMDDFIWVAVLLFLFIFIYSLLGMQIYGGQFDFPDNNIRQNFDNFVNSFIVVFQLITMENWQQILILTFRSSVYKVVSAIYLISWIWIGNFIFLNLFLSILLDGFVLEDDDSGKEYEIEESEYIYESNEQQPSQPDNLLMLTSQNNNFGQKNLVIEEPIKQSYYIRMSTEEEEEIKKNVMQEKQKHKKPIYDGVKCEKSLFWFKQSNWIRIFLYRKCVHPVFEHVILTFIIISSLKLVVDTYINEGSTAYTISGYLDVLFNAVFIIESVMKIISFGFILDTGSYLQDSWNKLDFFIVASSVIDMSFESVDLPVIKILRLLRTLRPLRFISHNKNMKIVIIALLSSITPILNVLIVIFMVWIMFAILGISLLGNRLNYCNVPKDESHYNINYDQCIEMGYKWEKFDLNYDNIFSALNSLFVISSLEGWPDYMYQAIDSQSYPSGPIEDSYTQIFIFFVIFILIGSFFLVNLFVGVIFMYFDEAQKNEKINILVTPEQQRWIEFQEMLIGVKAQFQANDPPTNKIRRYIYKISESGYFEAFIMICIILNIVTMGMVYEGQSQLYTSVLEMINYVFTTVFIIEMLLKLIGYGLKVYWLNSWNKFDAFVVIASIIDIIMSQLGSGISLLRVGPQLIRIMRVLRVSRLLKLVKSMKDLHSIIETLVFSLPSIINVAGLLFLFFFIFSVLGVFLFNKVTEGQIIDEYVNFKNFGYAMLTLFRCSTGEDWALIMFDCSRTKNCIDGKTCGTIFSIPFFLIFILVTQYIMLNLFIMIIVQFFEEYNLSEENSMNTFNEKIAVFRHYWSKYSRWSKGERIKQKQCASMLSELPEPLGYGGSVEVAEIFRDVMSWKLEGDGNGNYFFNELLYACMKKAYGFKEMNQASNDIKLYLQKFEADTKIKIQEKKRKLEQENRQKLFQIEAETMSLNAQKKQVNPMVLYLFTVMAFKAWKTYSNKENMPWLDISSSNSDNDSEDDDEFDQDLDVEQQNSEVYQKEDLPEVQEDLDEEDQQSQMPQTSKPILDQFRKSIREISQKFNQNLNQNDQMPQSILRKSAKKLTYQPQISKQAFSRPLSNKKSFKSPSGLGKDLSNEKSTEKLKKNKNAQIHPQIHRKPKSKTINYSDTNLMSISQKMSFLQKIQHLEDKKINQQELSSDSAQSDTELKLPKRKSLNLNKNSQLQSAKSIDFKNIDIDEVAKQIEKQQNMIMSSQIGSINQYGKKKIRKNTDIFQQNDEQLYDRKLKKFINPKSQHLTSITMVDENALKFMGRQLRNRQTNSSFSQNALLNLKYTGDSQKDGKLKKQ